ncbi:FkbM family methyltransferase, partial [Patescibacteria group bacterium]|nr:FkbM family methyltransferase [Patescibacteria group bacterium]
MRIFFEKFLSGPYRIFRKIFFRNETLRNDSAIIRYFVEPFIRYLSKRKKFFLFPQDPWNIKLRLLLGWREPGTVKLCPYLISSGMTVLDIGAHVGYYSRLFSELVGPEGKVYAFEPHPPTFALLQRNLLSCKYKNFMLSSKALSDQKGRQQFFEVVAPGGNSLYDVTPLSAKNPQGYVLKKIWHVETATLDDELGEFNNPIIDFIKMDVEGSEPKILKGARNTIARSPKLAMVVEFQIDTLRVAGVSGDAFLKLLEELGFEKILAVDEIQHKIRTLDSKMR